MTKTFTRNDMIRYFYNEMPEDEAILFQQCLVNNSLVRTQFQEVVQTLDSIDHVMVEPPNRVIQSIKDYSRNTERSRQKA